MEIRRIASGRVWHCVNEIVIMNERNEGKKEGRKSIDQWQVLLYCTKGKEEDWIGFAAAS